MSVQIDMEMPRSCLDCRFCIEESSGGANCAASGIWGREICKSVESIPCVIRKKWCPLTETTDTKWHVVAEGDLPEEVNKTYQCTVLDKFEKEIVLAEILYGTFVGFFCDTYLYEVLAWRELPEPWEGAVK